MATIKTKTVIDNWRVEVVPDFRFSCRSEKDLCDEVAAAIKRHVDDVATITVANDRKEVCPFCDYEWENCIDENGYPCCCDAAGKLADELGIKPVL